MRCARFCVLLALCLFFGFPTARVAASIDPAKVPLFEWRARVATVAGQKPEGKKFTFSFAMTKTSLETTGDAWSEWSSFDREKVGLVVGPHSYPNIYMNDFPVVLHFNVNGAEDPTLVEVEAKLEGSAQPVAMSGELYGPGL